MCVWGGGNISSGVGVNIFKRGEKISGGGGILRGRLVFFRED